MIQVGNYIYKKVEAAGRFESDDAERAKDYLRGVVILDGDGTIDLGDKDEVWIGIVHDGSGYTPGAAVSINQNRYHSHPDIPLQAAHEILTEKLLEDTEHVKELQEEWPDDWYDILTEGSDGMVFGPFKHAVAADIFRSDKYASKYIDIEEAEEEEDYK